MRLASWLQLFDPLVRSSISISNQSQCHKPFIFRAYGGDEGARTRDLCHDRSAFDRNPLILWVLMANKSTVSH